MTDTPPPDKPQSIEQQPRWAWWMAGIAIPLIGILVSVFLTIGSAPPAIGTIDDNAAASEDEVGNDPVEEPSPSASSNPPPSSPEPSPSTDSGIDLTAPEGYTLREGYWGITRGDCTASEQRMVDLDTGITETVVVSYSERGEPVEGYEHAELVYYEESCSLTFGNYRLKNLRDASVGLLTVEMPHDFATCQSISGTGLGPLRPDRAEGIGFIEGAAVCAVTDQAAVAMAMVDTIDGDTVNGKLYVWESDST